MHRDKELCVRPKRFINTYFVLTILTHSMPIDDTLLIKAHANPPYMVDMNFDKVQDVSFVSTIDSTFINI